MVDCLVSFISARLRQLPFALKHAALLRLSTVHSNQEYGYGQAICA
jgi:hypothetical protein